MSAVVAWTKRVIGAITVLAACGGDTFAQDSNPNVLTNEEKDAGFELLFNGWTSACNPDPGRGGIGG